MFSGLTAIAFLLRCTRLRSRYLPEYELKVEINPAIFQSEQIMDCRFLTIKCQKIIICSLLFDR